MTSTGRITLWKWALLVSTPLALSMPLLQAKAADKSQGLGYTEEVIRPGEIDPNTLSPDDEMPLPGQKTVSQESTDTNNVSEETHDAAEVYGVEVSSPPDVKSVRARKKEGKAVSASGDQKPPAREIPLIETQNEATSDENVVYVTGGVGDEERHAIEASKADYNVHVTNTSKSGAFEGDVHITITEQSKEANREMLNIVAGPLLYVRLPQGKYTLTATLGERSATRTIILKKKGQGVNFNLSW